MKSVKAEPPHACNEEGKTNWVKKIMSLLSVQEKTMRLIDSSKDRAAVNWFEQNVDRVVGVYGKQYGITAEDIVLGRFFALHTLVYDTHDESSCRHHGIVALQNKHGN